MKLSPLFHRIFEVCSLIFVIGYVTLYKQEILRSKGETGYLIAIIFVIVIVIASVIDKRTWLSQLLRGRLGKKNQGDTILPSKEKPLKRPNSSGRHVGSVGFHIGFLVFVLIGSWYGITMILTFHASGYVVEELILVAVICGGSVVGGVVGLVLAILAAMKGSS